MTKRKNLPKKLFKNIYRKFINSYLELLSNYFQVLIPGGNLNRTPPEYNVENEKTIRSLYLGKIAPELNDNQVPLPLVYRNSVNFFKKIRDGTLKKTNFNKMRPNRGFRKVDQEPVGPNQMPNFVEEEIYTTNAEVPFEQVDLNQNINVPNTDEKPISESVTG